MRVRADLLEHAPAMVILNISRRIFDTKVRCAMKLADLLMAIAITKLG
jgi:hypothetical protein